MTEDWHPFRLSEICEYITDGKHGDCTPEPNSGFYFLSAKDVVGGHLLYDNARQITESDFDEAHRRTRLEPNDILFTNSGTIGRMAIAKHHKRTCHTTFQKSVAILKPRGSQVDPRFLYNLLRYDNSRLSDLAAGTAQKNLLLIHLRNFVVHIPNLTIQRKIAAILSAYDDLIENNTRRIQILEEMAQALHREWFVHFRFPGHEQSKMVESEMGLIPEGWSYSLLREAVAELESGSRPKGGIDPSQRGVPSVGAENINGLGQYDYSKEKYVSQKFYEGMRRGHIQSGDVLLYKDGAHIGKKALFRDGFPHEVCCINEHVFILRCNKRISQSYLYFWLDQSYMTTNIRNLNANAAQPGINQVGVQGLPLLIPDTRVLNEWEAISEPILAELFNLAKKNNNLRQTRDLLLPKLISGEVDVSDLDIAIGE